jgi:hypothetical protein
MTKGTRILLCASLFALLLLLAGCAREAEQPAERAAAPTAAPAAPAIDPATAATLTGKVLYKDGQPQRIRLKMDADAACSRLHTGAVYAQNVVVNDNGTLRYAFVYVKDGPGNQAFPAPKQPVVLDQKGCVYEPHVIGLLQNQELHIVNSDPTTHNVHPVPTTNREWNQSQPPGSDKLVQSFAREEIGIPVKCNIHPWMRSYIHVMKHPFFAVTGADGSFEIKGLPPGNYTIAVWQEELGSQEQKVTLAAKESKGIDFTLSPKAGGA